MFCWALGERDGQNPMAFDDTHSLIAVHGELRADDAALPPFDSTAANILRGDAKKKNLHELHRDTLIERVAICEWRR